jgi:hypothetical protein
MEFDTGGFYEKSVEKTHIWLKSGKNIACIEHVVLLMAKLPCYKKPLFECNIRLVRHPRRY